MCVELKGNYVAELEINQGHIILKNVIKIITTTHYSFLTGIKSGNKRCIIFKTKSSKYLQNIATRHILNQLKPDISTRNNWP